MFIFPATTPYFRHAFSLQETVSFKENPADQKIKCVVQRPNTQPIETQLSISNKTVAKLILSGSFPFIDDITCTLLPKEELVKKTLTQQVWNYCNASMQRLKDLYLELPSTEHPERFICPISYCLMREPYQINEETQCFEKEALETYLGIPIETYLQGEKEKTSPMSGSKIKSIVLNRSIRESIEEYWEKELIPLSQENKDQVDENMAKQLFEQGSKWMKEGKFKEAIRPFKHACQYTALVGLWGGYRSRRQGSLSFLITPSKLFES